MNLIKSALREMKTTDSTLATHFSRILQTLKRQISHIHGTVEQTVYISTKNGNAVKAEHATAIDHLNKVLDKATFPAKAPATSAGIADSYTSASLDDQFKKSLLAKRPDRPCHPAGRVALTSDPYTQNPDL